MLWSLLKRFWPLALLAVAVLAFWAYGEAKYRAGQAERQKLWDESTALLQAEVRRVEAERDAATGQVEIRVVEKLRTIHEKGDTIVKQVPVYVPAESCDLPGGWRLLHNAAAAGQVPDPAGLPDAAPVPAQTAAITVAENYTGCNANAEVIEGWQQWAKKQMEVQ